MLQLDGFWRNETFQILLVLENDVFRIEGKIFGVNVEVPLYIRGRRK
jgi:hypothetical protein